MNMHSQLAQQSLTEAEMERLADFLEEVGTPAMNLEMLDGFCAALICGPDTVPPSEYLPQIFGEGHAFDSNDQAVEILGLVMRHWNTIASELSRTLENDHVYLPVMLENADGAVHGNDWAHGFKRGVQLRLSSWQELIDSEAFGGAILPIMLLTNEYHPDPAMRPPALAPDKRDELLQCLIAGLTHIYRYFALHRQWASQVPLRRHGTKVGRNDQCPCGSGRKSKHCCATSATKFH